MKIYVNKKPIVLDDKDYLKGGEACVFFKGDKVYKIFHNKDKAPKQGKICELQSLKHKNIILPEGIIENKNGDNIGFVMNKAFGVSIIKLFGNKFRVKNNINNNIIINLIREIQNTIRFIHSKGCLLVDGNEMNYYVDYSFNNPLLLDCNNWYTPTYKNNDYVLLQTIRDFSTNSINELTDWYAFAILIFKLFIGIHPFDGIHKQYFDTIEKMKLGLSVFNKECSLPKQARDMRNIPNNYFEWFKKLFHENKRELPPGDIKNITVVDGINKIISNDKIKFILIGDASIKNNLSNDVLKDTPTYKIYIKNNEIRKDKKIDNFSSFIASWSIMQNHRIFNGFIWQIILGSSHLSYPEDSGINIIKISELDLYSNIIDGKKYKNIIVLIANRYDNNKIVYDKIIIKVFKNKYKIIFKEEVNNEEVDFIILDNGIVCNLNNGCVHLFFNDYNNDKFKIIEDVNLSHNIILQKGGNKVLGIIDKKLYQLELEYQQKI